MLAGKGIDALAKAAQENGGYPDPMSFRGSKMLQNLKTLQAH